LRDHSAVLWSLLMFDAFVRRTELNEPAGVLRQAS